MPERKVSDRAILDAIVDLSRARGYPPTMREVGAAVGVSPAVIFRHLQGLRDQGEVTWEPQSPRTLRLTELLPLGGHEARG